YQTGPKSRGNRATPAAAMPPEERSATSLTATLNTGSKKISIHLARRSPASPMRIRGGSRIRRAMEEGGCNSRARPLPVGLAPGPRASSSCPPGYTPVRVLPVSGRTTYAGGRDGQTGARSPAGRDAARDAGELPGRPANGDLADGPDGLP